MKAKSILGDLNGDGSVGIDDAVLMANAFGSYPGAANWNSLADLNGDGHVNIIDVILLSMNFGKHA
jgi:hypothetical protein